jgi:NAD(P)-dependent dehydrogenase (short-subunit alcohol dehydrogenase family)
VTSFRLGGRSALVTGAARGIGLETARVLSARGASVMVTDIDGDEVAAAAQSIGGGTVVGVYRTVHAALPSIAARRGQVVIVASVYAFAAGVMVSPYAASKAAVEQLGRALRIELAAHGAGATVVYPGFAARGWSARP